MSINVVLFEPEIPQNTGNIARTCAATGSNLHLIKPLGFSVSDKYLKRAGLDYWSLVNITYYENFEEFKETIKGKQVFISTTKESRFYTDVQYTDDCYIIFGKETAGLPDYVHQEFINNRIKIPMIDNEHARSLNLANSVNIVMYEALRQLGFPKMI
ncbi:MAG TPA: tRNA (uridine(34)/cytosine(34)/5-carboxymethylaminomethyluridine(34)-2'-O)-methyltransferase TrmL [Clostridiales bacterium]|nr:tRNA (uridine(34)/cytosine(34)/5-carboxymethylaminomethyluridine(34)-2'-O)-methyltransferase TrmL [Clostridiales bacterium]